MNLKNAILSGENTSFDWQTIALLLIDFILQWGLSKSLSTQRLQHPLHVLRDHGARSRFVRSLKPVSIGRDALKSYSISLRTRDDKRSSRISLTPFILLTGLISSTQHLWVSESLKDSRTVSRLDDVKLLCCQHKLVVLMCVASDEREVGRRALIPPASGRDSFISMRAMSPTRVR